MAGEKCSDKFWELAFDKVGPEGRVCKEGLVRGGSQRDWVENDRDEVRRGVWRCDIAVYDRDKDTLTIDNCGWQTKLSKERLNQILAEVDYDIYQMNNEWYIYDRSAKTSTKLKIPFTIKKAKRRYEAKKRRWK